jgi:uncharacterized protein (UPF0276 family)
VYIGLNYEPLLESLIEDAIASRMLTAIEIIPDLYAFRRLDELRHTLRKLRVPYSFHFISNSPGSADFARNNDLVAFAKLMASLAPIHYSDHVTCCRSGSVDLRQNLPVPRTSEMVELFVDNIRLLVRTLSARRRLPFLIENVSSGFEFEASTLGPAEFYREIAERSGSHLLLDVHNIYVDEVNHGVDAVQFIESLPAARIREVHVAGGSWTRSRKMYLDSHDAKTPSRVLELLELVLARSDPELILLERQSTESGLAVQTREILDDLAELGRIHRSWSKRKRTASVPSSLSA